MLISKSYYLKKQIFTSETVEKTLTLMYGCGMDTASGQFAFEVSTTLVPLIQIKKVAIYKYKSLKIFTIIDNKVKGTLR